MPQTTSGLARARVHEQAVDQVDVRQERPPSVVVRFGV